MNPRRSLRSPSLGGVALLALFGMVGVANGFVVNIDAAVTGCTPCNGNHPQAGDTVSSVIAPVQVVLAPGTYTVRNGDAAPGANPDFGAWNFNSSGANWVWDFLIIDDATLKVVMDSCCGTQIYPTQLDAAQSAHALDFSQPFTLDHETTLDFVTEDYYPNDNAGGVALEVTPEPPAEWFGAGALATLAAVRSRRRATPLA